MRRHHARAPGAGTDAIGAGGSDVVAVVRMAVDM